MRTDEAEQTRRQGNSAGGFGAPAALLLALGANLLILAGYYALMQPLFETNDDVGIITMINGSGFTDNAFPILSNILIGRPLHALYQLNWHIPWYSLFLYGCVLLSLTIVSFVSLTRMDRAKGIAIALFMSLVFGYEGYILMQFTRVGAYVTAAGLLLLFDATDRERLSLPRTVIGCCTAVLGILIRFQSFLGISFILSGLGIGLLAALPHSVPKGERLRRLLRLLLVFGLTFILAFSCRLYDRMQYKKSSDWSGYPAYNSVRSAIFDMGLHDFALPDYDTHKDFYGSIGLSWTACNIYDQWSFADTELMSRETLEKIAAQKEKPELCRENLKAFLQTIPEKLMEKTFFRAFAVLLVLWLLCGRHGLPDILALLCSFSFFFVLYFYTYCSGRYLLDRTDAGFAFALCLVTIWLQRDKKSLPGRLSVLLPVITLTAALLIGRDVWPERLRTNPDVAAENRSFSETRQEFLQTVPAHPDQLFFSKVYAFTPAHFIQPFHPLQPHSLANFLQLGGWKTNSGEFLAVLRHYGVTNPYRAMVEKSESVCVIDNDPEQTLDYLQEYYDPDAFFEKLQDFENYAIYRFHP